MVKEIGIEATGGDISPLMLGRAIHLFDGDLVMADSHYIPFKNHTFDALAFITTFEYYNDPVKVIREAARVAKYGIAMDDEPQFSKGSSQKSTAVIW
jgi:ubiquinone/menaquinone biosynthesis C-methylase UbiE